MNFQEYINSDGLKRSSSVKIKPSDCVTFNKRTNDPKIESYIVLNICNDFFQYVVMKGSKHLRTVDTDGNPKKISCFILDDFEETEIPCT